MAHTLYLIRHGEVPACYQGRFIGSTDAPLSESGRRDCEALRSLTVDRIVASPLLRARETASFLAGNPILDERLREIEFGEWENLTFEEISRRANSDVLQIWSEAPERMAFPGGESVTEFFRRADAVFDSFAEMREDRIAVVTHGGVLMRMLSRLRGLPTSRQVEALPPRGSVTRLVWRMGQWNEVPNEI